MSFPVLVTVHLSAALLLFLSLGLYLSTPSDADRRLAGALHGTALLAILAAGVAMAQGTPWAAWIWVKVAAWLVLGVAPLLAKRRPGLRRLLLAVLPLAGLVAVWASLFKPGA